MLPSMKAHPKAVYEICNTDDDDDEDDAQHDQRQVELAPLFGRSPLAAAPSRHPDHASAGSKPFFTRVQHTCHQCHIWLLGLIIIFIAGVVAWLMLSSPNAHDAQAMDAGHEQHTSIPCWVYPGHNTSDAIGMLCMRSVVHAFGCACVVVHACRHTYLPASPPTHSPHAQMQCFQPCTHLPNTISHCNFMKPTFKHHSPPHPSCYPMQLWWCHSQHTKHCHACFYMLWECKCTVLYCSGSVIHMRIVYVGRRHVMCTTAPTSSHMSSMCVSPFWWEKTQHVLVLCVVM